MKTNAWICMNKGKFALVIVRGSPIKNDKNEIIEFDTKEARRQYVEEHDDIIVEDLFGNL